MGGTTVVGTRSGCQAVMMATAPLSALAGRSDAAEGVVSGTAVAGTRSDGQTAIKTMAPSAGAVESLDELWAQLQQTRKAVEIQEQRRLAGFRVTPQANAPLLGASSQPQAGTPRSKCQKALEMYLVRRAKNLPGKLAESLAAE